jgi:hypothetical protein
MSAEEIEGRVICQRMLPSLHIIISLVVSIQFVIMPLGTLPILVLHQRILTRCSGQYCPARVNHHQFNHILRTLIQFMTQGVNDALLLKEIDYS